MVEINKDERIKERQELVKKLDKEENYRNEDGSIRKEEMLQDKNRLMEIEDELNTVKANGEEQQVEEVINENVTEQVDDEPKSFKEKVAEINDVKQLKKAIKDDYNKLVSEYRETLEHLKKCTERKKEYREKVLKPMYANKDISVDELKELVNKLN